MSGLPRSRDIEFEKLAKKHGAYGVKKPTIRKRLDDAVREREATARREAEKVQRENEKREREARTKFTTHGQQPPPDYLHEGIFGVQREDQLKGGALGSSKMLLDGWIKGDGLSYNIIHEN